MKSEHLCPKCGGKRFSTVVHIAQDWIVDEFGNFEKVLEECTECVAEPDDCNSWTCVKCGAEAKIVRRKYGNR